MHGVGVCSLSLWLSLPTSCPCVHCCRRVIVSPTFYVLPLLLLSLSSDCRHGSCSSSGAIFVCAWQLFLLHSLSLSFLYLLLAFTTASSHSEQSRAEHRAGHVSVAETANDFRAETESKRPFTSPSPSILFVSLPVPGFAAVA